MLAPLVRRILRWGAIPSVSAVWLAAACTRREPQPAAYPAPYGQPPPYGAPAGYPPGTAPPPGQPGVPPGGVAGPPAAPVGFDPINAIDIMFLRGRAQAVIQELVANLPDPQRARVQGIPLIVDDEVGEVNAFAACTETGKAAMAISDGLLDIQAHLAQAKAIDELFGSRKVDEYIRFLSQNQRPQSPIVRPPPGFFDPNQTVDARKVARQHQVLDEEIAYVLGHELGHHYLGHLPCTAGSGVTASEIGRVLSSAVPLFNQPNELAADMAGVNNLLTTGTRRAYRYTETGALLTLQFFGGMDQFSPIEIVFQFERTHPPAAVRVPVVQQTAAAWRATGGRGLPIFGF